MSIKNSKRATKVVKSIAGHISFGEVLLSLRMDKEWTQAQMAEKLGITRQELCNIEKGHKSVSVDRAVAFARKLRHSQKVFAKYVLQDQLKKAGIKGEIEIRDVA